MQYVSHHLDHDDDFDLFPDVQTEDEVRAAEGAARLSTFFGQHEAGQWRARCKRRLEAVVLTKGVPLRTARALYSKIKGQAGLQRLSLYGATGQSTRAAIEQSLQALESLPGATVAQQEQALSEVERRRGRNKADQDVVAILSGKRSARPAGLAR